MQKILLFLVAVGLLGLAGCVIRPESGGYEVEPRSSRSYPPPQPPASPPVQPVQPVPPAAQAPQTRVFTDPTTRHRISTFGPYRTYLVDVCLKWGDQCGEPAASAWCRTQSYNRATNWTVYTDIGDQRPTLVLSEKKVCNFKDCDGFSSITCEGEQGSPSGPVRVYVSPPAPAVQAIPITTVNADLLFAVYQGTNRPGNDYDIIPNVSLESCKQTCGNNINCLAFTHWSNNCYLKDRAAKTTPLAGAETGLRQFGPVEKSVDRPGGDYRDFDLVRSDPLLCQAECANDSQCKSYTFAPPGAVGNANPHCWLKNTVPSGVYMQGKDGMSSGVRDALR